MELDSLTVETTRYWDGIAAAWKAACPQALWRAHSDAVNAALLRSWLPPCPIRRVLKTDLFDETVSEGLYPLLAARVECVAGVDLAAAAALGARSRYPGLQAAGADVRFLPFTDGAFDAVVSNSTLDHFDREEEIVAGLRELRRVLRPGGQLLLTLDNPANPAVTARNALPFRLLNRLGLVPYQVGATCGPHRLPCLLREAGFEVREVRAVMHCPRVLAVAAARLLERCAAPRAHSRFLRLLMAFELLSSWPTRFVTGHFVAVRAVRRES